MNGLRSLALVGLALALGIGSASAQSLAEVAKKEKERRQKNHEEAKRVITDRELSSTYGGLPATRAQTSTSEDSTEAGAASGEESPAGAESEETQDETKTREYWQNRVKTAKDKIAELEKQKASQDTGEGQPANVDPRGLNYLQRQQKLESDLAAARQALAAIQEEARRAGVPPGWVR